jgi:glycosyltransferase involved in cell wall biosynthesis
MLNLQITIVVPTYNRAALLPATLKSLQAQEQRDYEIIIVDDGSTDNTEEVVQPFLNSYTRYVKKSNAERAAARNYGAKLANGRYVNFFDSDDLALPNHTAEAEKIISEKNNPEWFHLAFEWVDAKENVMYLNNKRRGATLNKNLATGNHLGCNGVFVRRDIILTYPFNEDRDLSASEDYELWLRLAARFPLYYSNIITSKLIDHDSRSVREININRLMVRVKKLLYYVKSDDQIINHYGSDISKVIADSYSYVALHSSEQTRSKLIAIGFLFKALIHSRYILIHRRLFAIIRNILFRWQ